MALLLQVLAAICLTKLVNGAPAIAFPINSQLPPAARIGELFTYSFSPYTFDSTSDISYSLGDHPDWLSIDSDQRSLFGTPQEDQVPEGQVVGQTVEVIATDDSGSSTLVATLVVSRNEAPIVSIPIDEQIKDFGQYSAPSSLLLYPSTDFSYSFDPESFQPQSGLNYYAVSAESSPLPAWIKFDPASLTFSGITPPTESLVQPPETFGFQLVASDVEGFSAVSISFSIVVGSHRLTTQNPTITLNTTRGEAIRYEKLTDGIELDGKPVQPGDLQVTTEDMPSWLSFDLSTWLIEGTPEDDDRSTNFTLHFTDGFADTLDVLGVVVVATDLFKSTFDDLEVNPGDRFELDLAPHFWHPEDIKVSTKVVPDEIWLTLDDLTLQGRIPEDATGRLEISITAASTSNSEEETEILTVQFAETQAMPTISTGGFPRPTGNLGEDHDDGDVDDGDSGNDDSDDSEDEDASGLSTSQILLATILPILALVLILMLLTCLLRRRRNRRNYLASKYRSKISQPVLGSLRVNGSYPSVPAINREKTDAAHTYAFRNGSDYSASQSDPSSSDSSSGSDTILTPAMPPGFTLDHPDLSRSFESFAARHSWFTVEGTTSTSTGLRGDRPRSLDSDVTLPESTHQLLPTPSLGWRGGLDLMIPSLDDLSSLQPTPAAAYKTPRARRSMDWISTVTTSSEALPASRHGSRRGGRRPTFPPPTMQGAIPVLPPWADSTRDDYKHDEESASRVTELQPPTQARMSSSPWRRPSTVGGEVGQSSGSGSRESRSRSVQTVSSFASSENWRVIGRPITSYQNLGGAGGGDGVQGRVGGRDERGEAMVDFRREDSAGASAEGSHGSFKAFI